MTEASKRPEATARLAIPAFLYWMLLLAFLLSFIFSGNSISLVLTADRIIDATGMTIALVSGRITMLPPTGRFTYGYHRFESISSIVMIFAFMTMLLYSGYVSFIKIHEPASSSPLYTAIASLISLGALPVITFMLRGQRNETVRTMNIHSVQDIITTALALVASTLLIFYRSSILEFSFSVVIIMLSFSLNKGILTRNLRLLMEGTELNTGEIEEELREKIPQVHHVHIWDVCRHYRMATLHVYASRDARLEELDSIRIELRDCLARRGINHVTVQFEADGEAAD